MPEEETKATDQKDGETEAKSPTLSNEGSKLAPPDLSKILDETSPVSDIEVEDHVLDEIQDIELEKAEVKFLAEIDRSLTAQSSLRNNAAPNPSGLESVKEKKEDRPALQAKNNAGKNPPDLPTSHTQSPKSPQPKGGTNNNQTSPKRPQKGKKDLQGGAQSPRKVKFKPVIKREHFDMSQIPGDECFSPGAHELGKICQATCGELGEPDFAQAILKHHLWMYHGVGRRAGQPERVLIITGHRKDRIERLSIATAVLQAALHGNFIVLDHGGVDSIFQGLSSLPKVLPDIIGLCPREIQNTQACEAHRVTLCVETEDDIDDVNYAQGVCELAFNLAQGNKIIMLDVGTDLSFGARQAMKAAMDMDFVTLALPDSSKPTELQKLRWTFFSNTAYAHESELASFIHLHMTVDLLF